MPYQLTCSKDLEDLQLRMREHFTSQAPWPIDKRLEALRQFKAYLKAHEQDVLDALHADLGKSDFESYTSELMIVYEEINTCLKHLKHWARPHFTKTPLSLLPSTGKIYKRPKGLVLIISPWNYPLNLSLVPLVDALAAGNNVVLKCARASAHTSQLIGRLIDEVFAPEHVCVVEGPHLNDFLLNAPWDQVMFTGSPTSARHIMSACAQTLSPVILELGGKSPCIIDRDTSITRACERIIWGKSLNSGQTCVAPDYILVPRERMNDIAQEMVCVFKRMFGDDIASNPEWPHLVNQAQYDKISRLFKDQSLITKPYFSGQSYPDTHSFHPAIFCDVHVKDPLMCDEIFGPLIPLVAYSTLDEAVEIIGEHPSPLALYYFGQKEANFKFLLNQISFGGACVNDVVTHVANHYLPFGGIGNSGMGQYHGKTGFDAFTHSVSRLKTPAWFATHLREAPFKDKLSLVRRFIH